MPPPILKAVKSPNRRTGTKGHSEGERYFIGDRDVYFEEVHTEVRKREGNVRERKAFLEEQRLFQ